MGIERRLAHVDPVDARDPARAKDSSPRRHSDRHRRGRTGSTWVAEGLARQVVQVFPDADRVSPSVPIPGCCRGPSSVAVARRAVWVGDSTGIWRIDPRTRTVRPSGAQWTAAGGATVDPQGNAWFTDGWGHVVYISHDAGLRERHAQSGEPSGIAWGSGGVWVALPHTGAVARFSDTGESGPLIKVSGSRPPSRSARVPCGWRTRAPAPSLASTR